MPTSIDAPLALCVPPCKGGDATLFEMRADAVRAIAQANSA